MSLELQIRTDAVAAMVSRSVREQLRTTCLQPFAGFSIDHVDVVPGGSTVGMFGTVVPAPTVRVPLDVFIVFDVDLFAKPNDMPVGASAPAGRVTPSWLVSVELKPPTMLQGKTTRPAVLRFSPGPIDLGPFASVPGIDAQGLEKSLRAAMPTLEMDLSPLLSRLGLPAPNAAEVVIADGVLAVRFDATQTAQSRLIAGQEWGVFVGGPTVERILLDRLMPIVKRTLPQADVSARYEAVDGVPRVVAEVTVAVESDVIPGQWRMAADIGAGLSLVRPLPASPSLRASVDWSFHIFADGVPGFLEGAAESIAESIADDLMDPAQFGGTRTGERAFVFDLPLPGLAVRGVQLRFDGLLGTADGMTIGGAVLIAGLYEPAFRLTVGHLSDPLRIQLCSELARTGSGARSPEPPTIYNTNSNASISITGCGALCSITYRSPPEPALAVRTYLSPQSLGTPQEQAELFYRIPYFVAQALNGPLTLVVRTPRGVRFVDLGHAPQVQSDEHGVIQGRTRDYYINNCLNVVPGSGAGAGAIWGMVADDFKTRPIEEPDWSVYVGQAAGLNVQLVSVQGADAGELLRFRSATHAIDVTADAAGRAVVPVMLPLSADVSPARLVRANGRPIAGMLQVESVAFERLLTLPGKLHPGLSLTPGGSLRVATHTPQALQLHTVSPTGLSRRRRAASEELRLNPQPLPPSIGPDVGLVALNPQPLPPVDSPEIVRAWGERAGLHGLAQVFALPGHGGANVAVAVMDDGSKLMLDLRQAGQVRVAGTFAGPIGAFDVAGRWAVADAAGQVAVFRRVAAAPMACCGTQPAMEQVLTVD